MDKSTQTKRNHITAIAKAHSVNLPNGQVVATPQEWEFLEALVTPKVATAVSGSTRAIVINGAVYWIKPNRSMGGTVQVIGTDEWQYTLPNGETFTHPEKFGALLMCLKHAGGDEWAEWDMQAYMAEKAKP